MKQLFTLVMLAIAFLFSCEESGENSDGSGKDPSSVFQAGMHVHNHFLGTRAPVSRSNFRQESYDPATIRSENGKLDMNLFLTHNVFVYGDDTVRLRAYSNRASEGFGAPMGPVIRIKPNDVVNINLHNSLPNTGDIHYQYYLPLDNLDLLNADKVSKELEDQLVDSAKVENLYRGGTEEAPSISIPVGIEGAPILVVQEGIQWNINGDSIKYTVYLQRNIAQSKNALMVYTQPSHDHSNHNIPHKFNITNLHFHGSHLSPEQDDIWEEIDPSDSSLYHYDLVNHQSGTHWYHPHVHGSTSLQVASGVAGAMIVEDIDLDNFPWLREASRQDHEQVMLFDQIFYHPKTGELVDFDILSFMSAAGAPELPQGTTINGRVRPGYAMDQGEVQRWRWIHKGFKTALAVHFPEDLQVWQIAVDGIYFKTPVRVRSVHMAPGNRTDLIIKAPKNGMQSIELPIVSYTPQCEYFHDEQVCLDLDADDSTWVATVDISGEVNDMEAPTIDSPLPPLAPGHADLKDSVSINTRFTRFNIADGKFMVNGEEFAADTIHETPLVNTVEDWKVSSANGGHPYHIHINPFQVMTYGGRDLPNPMWKDVIYVTNSIIDYDEVAGDTGKALIKTRYNNFIGDFVMHCHILDHEDKGMMQKIRLVATCEESDLKPEQCPDADLP